jgi:L-threonylcarbamoyladenylate synthase
MTLSSDIRTAAASLRQGELVAFPTETVYGLGADAKNDRAVAKVFEAKGRPSFNPLISHVADIATAFSLGEFTKEAQLLAGAFWPGPLTLVVPRAPDCKVSMLASAGLRSIAVRVPDHHLAHQLLREFGGPVVAPSANVSGRLSPTTAGHVKEQLGSKAAMILDGGACPVGLESTIVGFLGPWPTLLRPGGLPREAIEEKLGRKLIQEEDNTQPHAPGQLASHYAPRATLRLNAHEARNGETLLGFGPKFATPYNLSPSADLMEAAANLFRLLHEIDASGASTIAVAAIPDHGLGAAINDRLRRAAAPRPAA